eukprot:Sspe_Gene.28121::Locus_12560_Transcript_1_1_Confidence_1.000_Length_1759::g.28121::m.28121
MERCAGVTCEAGNTNSCSLRFNKACDPDNQLKKSDSKETSWLKKCDCSYARKDQMFITCNPEEGKKAPEVETLEEAKITCDMTYGDCKGVSCKLIDGEPKECTAHDAWVCGPGEMGTDQARVAFMKECNEPVSSKCVWREKPDLAINCKSDKEHEKQVFRNVDDAKKACENQLDNTSGSTSVALVWRRSSVPTSFVSCSLTTVPRGRSFLRRMATCTRTSTTARPVRSAPRRASTTRRGLGTTARRTASATVLGPASPLAFVGDHRGCATKAMTAPGGRSPSATSP